MSASASEFGIPVISGHFEKRSLRVAAHARQKINMSAALACAASSDHKDLLQVSSSAGGHSETMCISQALSFVTYVTVKM